MKITSTFKPDVVNLNNMIYPKVVFDKAIEQYKKVVEAGLALGELGQGGGTMHLDRVSHKITNITCENGELVLEVELLDTLRGNIAKNLLPLVLAVRGIGSVKTNEEGIQEVQDDFEILTFDLVEHL